MTASRTTRDWSNRVERYRSTGRMCRHCRDRCSERRRFDDRGVERQLRHRSYRNNDLRDKCPRAIIGKIFRAGKNKMDTGRNERKEPIGMFNHPLWSQCPCDWEPYRQRDECRAPRHAAQVCSTLPTRRGRWQYRKSEVNRQKRQHPPDPCAV
jgi:hypothetical protein